MAKRGRKVKDQSVPLTKGQAAALCGVTYNTFNNWTISPLPPPEPDDEGRYCSIAIGEYIRARAEAAANERIGAAKDGRLDGVQERARKDKAQADKLELENQLRRGELIDMASVQAAGMDMVMRAKSRLMRVPSATAPLLLGQDDQVRIQNILDSAIRDALTELSVMWVQKNANSDGE